MNLSDVLTQALMWLNNLDIIPYNYALEVEVNLLSLSAMKTLLLIIFRFLHDKNDCEKYKPGISVFFFKIPF